ncbi:MAG: BamA/TamA family outer membrane protein [Candidatus Omnitrophica bacterium]|nr:BamA/TamA family outer membrane protein [Candidatus Omnitrophota bacterium]MCM8828615.1 BamA/TamA family outer membrane protein [Candidatus Omnitrophota bacterium]
MGSQARKVVSCAAILFFSISLSFSQPAIPDKAKAGAVESAVEKTAPKATVKPSIPQIEVPPRPEMEIKDTTTKIKVSKFKITGNTRISTYDLSKIVRSYEGREMTLVEIKAVADRITSEYREKGYFLARAYIPAQKIQNGVVEIAVIEGNVDKITIKGNKYYTNKFIRSQMQPVIAEQVISRDNLQKSLLNLNENPKLNVNATLSPGSTIGTVDINLDVKDSVPYNLVLYYNNFGSEFTGRGRLGASLDIGNLTKHGDILSLGIVLPHPDWDFSFYRKIGYSFPVNGYGTRLGLNFADMNYEVGKDLAILGIEGDSRVFELSLTHPFIKRTDCKLTAGASLAIKNYENYILGQKTAEDNLSMLGIGVSRERIRQNARDMIAVNAYFGLGGMFGGMGEHPKKPSKPGADNTFLKLTLDAARTMRLGNCSLILRGSGQWANQTLAIGEKFAIGGPDSVRGYPQSEYLGDKGYALSAELRTPVWPGEFILNKYAQWAFFFDWAGVELENPLIGEKSSQTLSGYGAGIRAFYKNFDLRFDAGFPIKGKIPSDGGNYHYYIQGTLRF